MPSQYQYPKGYYTDDPDPDIDICRGFPKLGSTPLKPQTPDHAQRQALQLRTPPSINPFLPRPPLPTLPDPPTAFRAVPTTTTTTDPSTTDPATANTASTNTPVTDPPFDPDTPITDASYDSEATITDPDADEMDESDIPYPNSSERYEAEAIFALLGTPSNVPSASTEGSPTSTPSVSSNSNSNSNNSNAMEDMYAPPSPEPLSPTP